MAFKNFDTMVSVRVAAIFLSGLLTTWLIVKTEHYVAIAFLATLTVLQLFSLLHFVKTTQRELGRFMGAIQNSDFSQTFSYKGMGPAFEELGDAFTMVLDHFRSTRSEKEEQGHYLRMLMDHIPVALVTIHDDGRVEGLNNAARRMFSPGFPRTTQEFSRFGNELEEAVEAIAPGDARVVRTDSSVSNRQLKLEATEIIIGGEHLKILSFQDIQSELDATEFEAWRELGRVLTHELMNSLTPVSSLAGTATNMLADLKEKADPESPVGEDLEDIQSAVEAVARRSEGLLHFVENYRQVMRVPPPVISRFKVREICERTERLMAADMEARGITCTWQVAPTNLEMDADPDLLEQALINLVRNARDALEGREEKKITVKAGVNKRNRVEISVADTGGGIPSDVAERIFVPFFTTKESGAGIGLSFSRQIMLAHKGTIDLATEEGKGTTVYLRF